MMNSTRFGMHQRSNKSSKLVKVTDSTCLTALESLAKLNGSIRIKAMALSKALMQRPFSSTIARFRITPRIHWK